MRDETVSRSLPSPTSVPSPVTEAEPAAAFTPGPWYAKSNGGLWGVLTSECEDVAAMPLRSDRQDIANAHLMAAAPDMFAALRGDPEEPEVISPLSWLHCAIDELVQRGPPDECDDVSAYWSMIDELRAMHRNATAAIANALDQTPEGQ